MRFVLFVLFAPPLFAFHPGGHIDPAVQAELDKKVSFYEKRLEKNPEDTLSLGFLARLYLDQAKQSGDHGLFEKARTVYERILGIDPESRTARLGLGYTLMGNHHFHKAMQQARELAERAPQDRETRMLLGDLHFALGHHLEAELCFEAMRVEKEDPASLTRLAQVRWIRGDYEAAETLFQKAASSAAPDSTTFHAWLQTMLADLDLEQGRIVAAAEHLEKAVELEPGTHYAFWRSAQIALHNGDTGEAYRLNRKALKHSALPQYKLTMADIRGAMQLGDAAKKWETEVVDGVKAEVEHGDLGHLRVLAEYYLDREDKKAEGLTLALMDLQQVRQDPETVALAAWAQFLNGNYRQAGELARRVHATGYKAPKIALQTGIIFEKVGMLMQAKLVLAEALPRAAFCDPDLKKAGKEAMQRIGTDAEHLSRQFNPSR